MGLQRITIQKLLRENFPGTNPLVVKPAAAAREKLGAEIKDRLSRFDGVDTKDAVYLREEEKPRHIASFSIIDPEPKYSYYHRDSFCLTLDDDNQLTIREYHHYAGRSALVGDLDEIVHFVQEFKQRLERQRAKQVQRGKVRELLAQAILAQVKKVAKEERFDFMSETDAQKLNLFVKLSETHAIELNIPFKEFKKILPQLKAAIVSLRQMYQSGIRYHIVGRRSLPWRTSWVKHESL